MPSYNLISFKEPLALAQAAAESWVPKIAADNREQHPQRKREVAQAKNSAQATPRRRLGDGFEFVHHEIADLSA